MKSSGFTLHQETAVRNDWKKNKSLQIQCSKKKKKTDIRAGAKVHFMLAVLSFILHVFERQLSSELSHLLVCVGLLVLSLDGQLLGFLLDQQPAGR